MPRTIELRYAVDEAFCKVALEQANGYAHRSCPAVGLASQGSCAARSRDAKLLLTLERMSECMDKLSERDSGESRRSAKDKRDRLEPKSVQLIREAYRSMDVGEPEEAFGYLYGAVARLQGVISGSW